MKLTITRIFNPRFAVKFIVCRIDYDISYYLINVVCREKAMPFLYDEMILFCFKKRWYIGKGNTREKAVPFLYDEITSSCFKIRRYIGKGNTGEKAVPFLYNTTRLILNTTAYLEGAAFDNAPGTMILKPVPSVFHLTELPFLPSMVILAPFSGIKPFT